MIKNIIFFTVIICFFSCYADSNDLSKTFRSDDPEYVELIIKSGKGINEKEEYHDRVLLHTMSEYGKYRIAKALIERGAEVNAKDMIDYTPLHYASRRGRVEIVNLLLQNGAKVNVKGGVSAVSGDRYKETPLHLAARHGHINIVKLLVENGADFNEKNYKKYTPLHYAIEKNHKDIANYLIIKGANVNTKESYGGDTPLIESIRWKQYEISENILEKGGCVNAGNKEGETPLHYAARRKNKKIVATLIAFGGDLKRESKRGKTPLDEARQKDNIEVIIILQKAETPEVQKLIKEGRKEEVIKILTEAANSTE
jgi:ankyrin repeat protein